MHTTSSVSIENLCSLLILLIIFASCGGSGSDNSSEQTPSTTTKNTSQEATEETPVQNSTEEQETVEPPQAVQDQPTDRVLKEYPNGLIATLSNEEVECLNANVDEMTLRQIEADLDAGRPLQQGALDALSTCNIANPEEAESTETSTETVQEVDPRATIVNITSLNQEGVSPHLEVVDSTTLRMFYSSEEAGGLAVDLCDYDLNCTRQGVVDFVQDLTLVETVDGVRRGYFVELNTETKNKEIWTAVVSEDGLTFSDKVPLGFIKGDYQAWGVPDAVLLPDGRVRIYWVDEPVGMAGERIVSATSETTKGVSFVKDSGYRFENGYVDLEVLKAEEGDWEAIFSFSPEKLPQTPQSLFYGTSTDGLSWEFSGIPISPLDMSYLDPTGVVLSDGSYLIVSAVASNELGTRKYTLYSMQMTLP